MSDDGIFQQPPNSMPEIKSIWAYVVLDPRDGNEGVPAILGPDGIVLPLIASDRIRREQYRPHAQSIADNLGVAVKLVEFQNRVEVEVLEPKVYKSTTV
jgi:hypothetical protein